jgi:hypothetical protein
MNHDALKRPFCDLTASQAARRLTPIARSSAGLLIEDQHDAVAQLLGFVSAPPNPAVDGSHVHFFGGGNLFSRSI